MMIRDVMEKDVVTVRPDDECAKALKLLQDRKVGAIVVKDSISVLGMLTDRDLLVRGHGNGQCFMTDRVSQYMSNPVTTISPDKDVFEGLHVMKTKSIRRLPVVEADRLVGIVSWSDLSAALGEPVNDLITGRSRKTGVALHA